MEESSLLPRPESKETLDTCINDSPTKVTNSNTSSETASYGEEEHDSVLLASLARQLEFYFSPANLIRDTYLQTLQSLNDGYVPVVILANFAKVQALCVSRSEQERIHAVIKAACHYSEMLQVVSISTVTNKKVQDEDATTISAVGPRAVTTTTATTTTTTTTTTTPSLVAPKSPIQNTIILRDVPDDAKEEDVRALFDNKSCPPLTEVRLDVANCWFVTLDTTSREAMMSVMMDLRCKTLKDEPVKARLKSASTAAATATATSPFTPRSTTFAAFDPNALAFPAPPELQSPSRKQPKSKNKPSLQPKNNTTKGSRARKRTNHSGGNGMNATTPKQQQQPQPPSSSSSPKKVTPPKIQEAKHFPALVEPSVAVDNIKEKVSQSTKSSDAASTTTTTSSTTSSTTAETAKGGYAAALLKAPTPTTTTTATTSTTKTTTTTKKPEVVASSSNGANRTVMMPPVVVEKKEEAKKEDVPVVPLTWGSGRSFADVLKQEETTTSS